MDSTTSPSRFRVDVAPALVNFVRHFGADPACQGLRNFSKSLKQGVDLNQDDLVSFRKQLCTLLVHPQHTVNTVRWFRALLPDLVATLCDKQLLKNAIPHRTENFELSLGLTLSRLLSTAPYVASFVRRFFSSTASVFARLSQSSEVPDLAVLFNVIFVYFVSWHLGTCC